MAQSTGTLTIPEAANRIPPTSTSDLDAAVATLRSNASVWVGRGIAERIALLAELQETVLEAAPAWVDAAAVAKGIASDSPKMGEDWISGPTLTVRNIRLLRQTLEQIRDTGRPQPPAVRTAANGQVVIDVFPTDAFDKFALFPLFTAEVRLDPSVGLEEAEGRMGRIYRPGGKDGGGVRLVLGAGNVSSIPAMDVLYTLFAEDRVCVLKMNPVNEHLGPHLAAALRPLIRDGLLRIVYGGAAEGAYLTEHDGIDEIHMTGSDKTFEAIVYGTGEGGARRKAGDDRKVTKPISAELGNVSPVIVVPGPWSDKDLAFQGENIASMLVHNAGFNCIAARMIVQHQAWARRNDLLDAVRSSLARAVPRDAYYPGARDRWETFVEQHPEAERFGDDASGGVPWTLIPGLDPTRGDDVAFTTEAFCGVFGEVGLDAPRSVPDYLDAAVEFCNGELWGTLSASILVHPRSLDDPEVAAAVERAIDRLRYGSVVVNAWSAVTYAMVSTPWGAAPGHEPTDIQSGIGVVHNTYLLEDVEKTVVRGPFRPPVKPQWFLTNRTAGKQGRKLSRLEGARDLTVLPSLTWDALRG
ncbi:MAG: aldehyde dehydrogenase family protein [Actinobacteria bacterium]|nr:aldehyde dehydrogenase family protein [Actinomycetota bacterium]